MMFTGTYQNSIDSKNRMIIPSRYRDMLGGHCMLTRGFDKCLYIYAMDDYEVLVDFDTAGEKRMFASFAKLKKN